MLKTSSPPSSSSSLSGCREEAEKGKQEREKHGEDTVYTGSAYNKEINSCDSGSQTIKCQANELIRQSLFSICRGPSRPLFFLPLSSFTDREHAGSECSFSCERDCVCVCVYECISVCVHPLPACLYAEPCVWVRARSHYAL